MDHLQASLRKARKKLYTQEELDDARIIRVMELLGEHSNPMCKHCKVPALHVGHTPDCAYRKIDPDKLKKAMQDANIEVRKNMNRQRIFKSDKKKWSGLPGGGKTLVKRRTTRNRGPNYELRFCDVCTKRRMFKNGRCIECNHKKVCELTQTACPRCHPREYQKQQERKREQRARAKRRSKKLR